MLNGRVLILSCGYEPVGTIGVSQAMCKLSKPNPTLQVLEWADEVIHTQKGEYPVPSVMRLNYYVGIIRNRDKSGAKRGKIFIRDKYRCQYCGVRMGQTHPITHKVVTQKDLTLDHITPVSQNGKTRADNLVTACLPCNQRKKNRTPEEARVPLLTSQTLLKVHLDTILMCNYAETKPEWKKYLFMSESAEGDSRYAHTGDS